MIQVHKVGHGDKGKLTWTVNENIVKVLEKAFYAAFSFVAPTGKKFCLAVDVSGSMRQPVYGISLRCLGCRLCPSPVFHQMIQVQVTRGLTSCQDYVS
jgi:60 kDa SS-A/Ro ribonucleoprotein